MTPTDTTLRFPPYKSYSGHPPPQHPPSSPFSSGPRPDAHVLGTTPCRPLTTFDHTDPISPTQSTSHFVLSVLSRHPVGSVSEVPEPLHTPWHVVRQVLKEAVKKGNDSREVRTRFER